MALLPSASASPPSKVRSESSKVRVLPESSKERARFHKQVENEFSVEDNIYELTEETVRIPMKTRPRLHQGEAQIPHTITKPVAGQKFPYVVPYPEGVDTEENPHVPVARQYEADGAHTDLMIGGDLRLYNADGYCIGGSGGCGAECRRRQGLGPDPKVALALWYKEKYRPKAMILPPSGTASE